MPRIVFFTTLTLWSMGAGRGGLAFTQTVKKYIDEGWEAFLISDEPSNKEYPGLDEYHNIVLTPTAFKQYGKIRKLGLLFRWLDHKCMTRRFCTIAESILKQNNREPTVLYAYEIFGVEASRRLARKHKLPFVTRFQGTILGEYLDRLNRYQWISRYPHCQAIAQPADLVIMTNDGTFGDRVLAQLGNHSPVLFLRNGLDLMESDTQDLIESFDRTAFRQSLGIHEDDAMFLTISRLTEWKRVERAIDGFADFLDKGGIGKLVIVGDGDAKSALIQRAEDLGITDQIRFTGSVSHDHVYSYMMAADVFLSLYDLSNVGNPLLEAMTLGKCIITLDVGDTRSLIHDRENGILLTMDTLPSLGQVMRELAGDPAHRQRLGDAAARYAQENFCTWEERMDREFQAVSTLLKR